MADPIRTPGPEAANSTDMANDSLMTEIATGPVDVTHEQQRRARGQGENKCLETQHAGGALIVVEHYPLDEPARFSVGALDRRSASLRGSRPIRPREQVADCPPSQVGQPPTPKVLVLVVQDVAPLAEGREVRTLVVLRVVVTVSGREDDAGGAGPLVQAVG